MITEAQVNQAQQAWCDGLINIGAVYRQGGDYRGVPAAVLDPAGNQAHDRFGDGQR